MEKDKTTEKNKTPNLDDEHGRNFEAFTKLIQDDSSILEQNKDKYALMRHEKLQGIYTTAFDAMQVGESLYEDKMYSIQQITNTPVDLGYYSHAVHIG